jgi:multimeric flavodoxin WrbA
LAIAAVESAREPQLGIQPRTSVAGGNADAGAGVEFRAAKEQNGEFYRSPFQTGLDGFGAGWLLRGRANRREDSMNDTHTKVVAFSGSARKGGNTAILLKYVLKELENEGIETELIEMSGEEIHGCRACRKCSSRKDRRCGQNDDVVNEYIAKMDEADGILLGSPTYVADVSPEIKALMDRACLVSMSNGGMFRRKVGAAVVAVRRAGAIHAFDELNHFFLINQMIVPGSSYWNIAIGREIGDVEKDEEGIQTMKVLGQNMAWLLKKVKN